MAADLLGEVLAGIIRPIARFIFVDLILHALFEFLIQGTGYAVCRRFDRNVSPDGLAVALVGLLIWGSVGVGVYLLIAGGSK